MKRLVIVLLGLTLLYSCGPVPESKATMSAPDGIIPFDKRSSLQVQESSVH